MKKQSLVEKQLLQIVGAIMIFCMFMFLIFMVLFAIGGLKLLLSGQFIAGAIMLLGLLGIWLVWRSTRSDDPGSDSDTA